MRARALGALLLVGGCALGPGDEPPTVTLPERFHAASTAAPADPQTIARYWRAFGDPALDALVARTIAANLDLEEARARLALARAQRRLVRSEDEPQLNATARGQVQRLSENIFSVPGPAGGGGGQPDGGSGGGFAPPGETIELYQLGFDAQWELDLFGRLDRRAAAASARVAAAQAGVADARVTVVAETVRAYLELREFQARAALTRENLGTARRTRNIVAEREAAGLETEFDVIRATGAVTALEASLPQLVAGAERSANSIAVLTGTPAGALAAELGVARPVPEPPEVIGVGLPAELLVRRPDIRRAEAELAAARLDIAAARAALLPSFRLDAALGLQADDPTLLFDWGSRFGSVAASLVQAIFDGGRRRAEIAIERAQAEQAVVGYRRAILDSLADVENALVALRADRARVATLEAEVRLRARAVDLALERYRAGLSTLIDVLDAQGALFRAREDLTRARAAAATDAAQLFKALGGGHEPEARPPLQETVEVR